MSMSFDTGALLQSVMDSKISALLYNSMASQQVEDRRMPDSTRRAFLARMRADTIVSRQGAQNMEDAAAMVTTAQSGVTSIKQALAEMRAIATDVLTNANWLTPEQFAAYTSQLQDYANSIVQTAQTTSFNGFQLLDGSAGMNNDGVITLQAGNSSVQEVLTNMLDGSISTVLGTNGEINMNFLSGMMVVTDAATAQAALDLIADVYKRIGSLEAKYSNDIKSLNHLAVLLESQADIFENVKKYHTDTGTPAPQSYLDALMNSGLVTGSIVSGSA